MAVFMQPIYTQTVTGSPVASIAFNNIPQGFSDLYILISTRMTNASTLGYTTMRFNDNTTNYSWTYLDANIGSTPFSARSANYNSWFVNTPAASSAANIYGNTWVRINDYVGGSFKQGFSNATGENNLSGSAWLTYYTYLFSKTDPITKVTFQDAINGANFAVGSTITIYGVSERYDTQTPTAPTIGTVTDQAEFASVAFTPASNDQADRYAVTTTPSSSTTFGTGSPIVAPAALNTSYTYQVAAVNSLGSSASAASSALTTFNSYSSIATVTAPSGAIGNFSFTNIPQNYKHLQLRFIVRVASGSAADEGYIYFNNANTEMMAHQMYADGSSTFVSGNAYTTVMFTTRVVGTGATANVFSAGIIDILDYTDTTKGTTVRTLSGWDANGSGQTYLGSGAWSNLSPVSSLTFRSNSNFAQYSHAALYGIA